MLIATISTINHYIFNELKQNKFSNNCIHLVIKLLKSKKRMIRTNSNYSITHDRYGYQGQEMDDEIKGDGNSVNYTFRKQLPR